MTRTIGIRSDGGHVRELEFIRFDGSETPIVVVKWGLAGAYTIDLRTGRIYGKSRIPVTNWRAENAGALLVEHAAWLKRRLELAKPAILRGGR